MQQKDNKIEFYNLDERSYEVKEILGQTPNWVIRWGISVLLIIVLLLVLGSSLISYNDIINARITITTKNPPAYIEAKSNGKLTNLFIEADQFVDKDQVLAVIENTADFNDVMIIKESISNFKPTRIDFDSLGIKFPTDLKLGTMQNSYNDFRLNYQNYLSYIILKPEKKEIANLSQQFKNQFLALQQLRNKLKYSIEELKGSQQLYNDYKRLFEKGIIAKHDFLMHEKNYLADKRFHDDIRISIQTAENNLKSLTNDIDKTSIDDKTSFLSTDQNLFQSLQNLKNQIWSWEQLYLLKSPIEGKLTLFDIRSKYQNIKVGDVIFTIVPHNTDSLIGYVTTPIQNSGKIKVGQTVIIKLDNYPFQEWGSLEGVITTISSVPKQNQYSVYVDISELSTSYHKKLEFKQEMQGTAQIVTEKLTVLQRIFYQSRKIFSRN